MTAGEEELGDFEFWLATMDGFCRLLAQRNAVEQGLVEPMYHWGSMAVFDQDTFAYLTMRKAPRTDDGQRTFELGVCAYGPRGEELADCLADQIRRWDRGGRSQAAWVASFAQMVANLDGHRLPAWLKQAEAIDLPPLKSLVNGIRQDLDAVMAGLSMHWNSGRVEGNVNRIKRINRDGYGRAPFDLLRLQILHAD